ncbi:hypothetical protein ACET3Z_004579 [Daucus carota]
MFQCLKLLENLAPVLREDIQKLRYAILFPSNKPTRKPYYVEFVGFSSYEEKEDPFVDQMQKGMLHPFLPLRIPKIPLADVAVEVVETGSEVKHLKAGDKFVAMLCIFGSGGGLA